MQIKTLHSWDLTPTEAVALQRELAGRVDTRTPLGHCALVAGADISYERFSPVFYAAVVVVRVADGAVVETQTAIRESPFPYVPGLLSVREGPAVLEAFAKLRTIPDAVMFDGQGYAHPRRIGLACHMGLWLNLPTLGCAKSLLVGQARVPGPRPGAMTSLRDGKDTIGKAVRTRRGIKPVYVSAGHKIDLASAVRLVLKCCRGYRLPEPTRQAHLCVNSLRRAAWIP
ncbi:MAG: endonuclease V [Planctomycetes bacterium]|nr:endonuclease V [Planctomycetota bacterium]